MKIILTALFFILHGVAAVAQNNEKTETRQLEPFDKIKISKGINVTLREGEKPEANIIILNAELEDVLIQQQGRELTLKMKTKIYKDVAVNVYVSYQNIREILAGTGSSLDSEDIIEADQLLLEAGMDASIEMEVEVKKLKVSATAARVQVRGIADYIEVSASTGGKYLGSELECKEAYVRASTGAMAQVYVTDKLDANAGTGAKVEYAGKPEKVAIKTTLGGKVEEVQ
ncbi:MAG: DUF2807 domain-containing protein [Cytophagaceae bacterium]|jgi:hypothetical protein|nr:DUF2807 domain-containing protein [Cytophagaceae bacterium]